MEALKSTIEENRKISSRSLNIYAKNLEKLAKNITGKSFKSTAFLKKYDDVISHLNSETESGKARYSLSTKKNYLASILVALSPKGRGEYEKSMEKVAKKYTDYLTSQAKEYENHIIEQKKSAKQNGKWTTMKELQKVRKSYANSIKKLG